MTTITVHIPTPEERRSDVAKRLVMSNSRQLQELSDRMARNLTRELYGCTGGTVSLVAPA